MLLKSLWTKVNNIDITRMSLSGPEASTLTGVMCAIGFGYSLKVTSYRKSANGKVKQKGIAFVNL